MRHVQLDHSSLLPHLADMIEGGSTKMSTCVKAKAHNSEGTLSIKTMVPKLQQGLHKGESWCHLLMQLLEVGGQVVDSLGVQELPDDIRRLQVANG